MLPRLSFNDFVHQKRHVGTVNVTKLTLTHTPTILFNNHANKTYPFIWPITETQLPSSGWVVVVIIYSLNLY